MDQNETFIIKINLDNINELSLNSFIQYLNILPNSIISSNQITYMNKSQYSDFIFNNSGSTIQCNNTDLDCSICLYPLYEKKSKKKIFKLYSCIHTFHYKCIKKWFKTQSRLCFEPFFDTFIMKCMNT